ncbi:MAG: M24 family metallopeptidase [Deltaproteobacteria bacterium]|nr:M24 family metallopeptidase [Deltaproteobacteria bacterium]
MAQNIQSPSLSLKERDRRYAAIRGKLKEKGVDCVIVKDSNLFYLTNGLIGERYGLFPTDESKPFLVLIHRRHLADLSAQVLIDSQDWVKDLQSENGAVPFIERIKKMGWEKGTIGVTETRSSTGGLSHGFYAELQGGLESAKFVDVSAIFANIRTIKSEEEIAMIDFANRVFDAGVKRVHEVARPGMLGKEVIQEAIKGMWDAGGDLESTVGFNFGPVPAQNPILGGLCMDRKIQDGDIGTLTAHAHYGGYGGHSDQEIAFGEPKPVYQKMFDSILQVRQAVLDEVKPGSSQRDLINVYKKACESTGFNSSVHSQIHQYGIDVPEFPGVDFRINDDGPKAGLGSAGNFRLEEGMIYSISPTLVGKGSEGTLLGGTSLVVTKDGHRELGNRKVELLVSA